MSAADLQMDERTDGGIPVENSWLASNILIQPAGLGLFGENHSAHHGSRCRNDLSMMEFVEQAKSNNFMISPLLRNSLSDFTLAAYVLAPL
jgi:hypothetical protein